AGESPSRLPTTEADVRLLELVARGLSDEEIGPKLGLSPHTVKRHLEGLRQAVNARNRTELAAWAGQYGCYQPPAGAPG
ncbi:MAG: helix-turn-helix transcriptional regulator, partial [Chloroflexi bacterium]|nr:helix-turn-helix transcriptional regulator [Chloroflexota bacterium]